MKRRYIQRPVLLQSRRKQIYHTQTKLADQPTITELIQQHRSQQEEKEKHEKE